MDIIEIKRNLAFPQLILLIIYLFRNFFSIETPELFFFRKKLRIFPQFYVFKLKFRVKLKLKLFWVKSQIKPNLYNLTLYEFDKIIKLSFSPT
jgi:hypothetical protein